jgi:hypothetical protein
MKNFKSDFTFFLNKIERQENFSLSRWGDGEMCILQNTSIDLLSKGNGEFDNKPDDDAYDKSRQLMNEAFTFQDSTYYIGIGCRCCIGEQKFEKMKTLSQQSIENLTWANIFVNSNYRLFCEQFIPALQKRNNVLISHRDAVIDQNFPLRVKSHFKVSPNAWVNSIDTIDQIKRYIADNNLKNVVFLFAAGPFANLAVYELHKFNRDNTYLDVGSVFDKMLNLKVTRRYLLNGPTLNKTCIW